jgi:hypothetical protein
MGFMQPVISRTGLLALLLALSAAPLQAHEGHDHGEAPAALPLAETGPRFEAASDLFELVGTLQGSTLTLYLDDYAGNAPIVKASLELETGARKYAAKESQPGVYHLDLADTKPGRHALVFTIQAGEESDLLTANLDIPPAATPVASGSGFDWRLLAWAGLPLLGFGLWRRWRGRKAHV